MSKLLRFLETLAPIGTFLSIVGACSTIYLGVYFLPSYLSSTDGDKEAAGLREVIAQVQELSAQNIEITDERLVEIIKAKELKLQIHLLTSNSDILAQAEDGIATSTYLPFADRIRISDRIEQARKKTPRAPASEITNIIQQKSMFLGTTVLSLVLAFFGLLGSFYQASRFNKTIVEKEVKERVGTGSPEQEMGRAYEAIVLEHLKSIGSIVSQQTGPKKSEDSPDFIVKCKDLKFGVEVRYKSTGFISDREIECSNQISKTLDMPVLLITNAKPNQKALASMDALESGLGRLRLQVLSALSGREIQEGLNRYLESIS